MSITKEQRKKYNQTQRENHYQATILLPKSYKSILDTKSKLEGISKSELVKRAIDSYLGL